MDSNRAIPPASTVSIKVLLKAFAKSDVKAAHNKEPKHSCDEEKVAHNFIAHQRVWSHARLFSSPAWHSLFIRQQLSPPQTAVRSLGWVVKMKGEAVKKS